MSVSPESPSVTVSSVETDRRLLARSVALPVYDRERFEDVAFLTSMLLVLFGNYSQSGHFGGPLAYTPMNVAVHLGGPGLGGLCYDLREPKHPFADRFLLAGGHSIPTCYALWMILARALSLRARTTGRSGYSVDPNVAILPVDALGFRRGAGALANLLEENDLAEHPLFSEAKIRGIRALSGHSESRDVTNDVNGGPSGIGVATSTGRALFLDFVGAPPSVKVLALEGEFAMTEGHAQEMKTAALAQQVGKRLRILLSLNNAGIDDELEGGVIRSKYDGYDIPAQWATYGWNVLAIRNGNDFDDLFGALLTMETWPADDRRPMIVIAPTTKGWWPAAVDGKLPGGVDQIVSYRSHPYAFPMNGEYFNALARTFEDRYSVEFRGIRSGVPSTERDRLIEYLSNVHVVLSAMESVPGLVEWIADRVLQIAGTLDRAPPLRIDPKTDPFLSERLTVKGLPMEPVEIRVQDPETGRESRQSIALFQPKGVNQGARRAISEVGKWLNYVTGGRFLTVAADLSGSVNLEAANLTGHYDPVTNPRGTRLKAAIQEAANAATMAGLVGQNASGDPDRFAGVWGISGTYGAFTPLMYTPARVFSQQNQDSPTRLGVLFVLAGHSGPETAADGRTHFGIFAPRVFTLFPRGQVVNLCFSDYNDVAPGTFAAVERAARTKEISIVVLHVARPDAVVADRSRFADPDPKAAAKGIYLIRDYDPGMPKGGTVLVEGASSTGNVVSLLDRFDAERVNVRIAAVISPELFSWQPEEYRRRIFPFASRYDAMVVSTMTKRVPPLPGLGPLTEEYSLYADHDDRWRTCGTVSDVVAEARLDSGSIFRAALRFASDRPSRMARQRDALE